MCLPLAPQPELKPGQMCIAQFSADQQFYRAYVEKALPQSREYEVRARRGAPVGGVKKGGVG